MMSGAPPHVQLLSVPGCPLVERARAALQCALAASRIHARVEELIGPHPSPTILIDGHDVVTGGRPTTTEACCRLELPTPAQIVARLRPDAAMGT
jgi:hypothetical protein